MKRGGFSTTNIQVNDMKHNLKALKLTRRIKNQVVKTLSRMSLVTEKNIKYPNFSLVSTHQLNTNLTYKILIYINDLSCVR